MSCSRFLLLTALPAAAQRPAAPPRLPPVVVEGAHVPPERTATEDEAREEIQRVPGNVDLIGRERILARAIGDGGRTLGPVRALSQAIKAWSPDVIADGDGFLVAWHMERFPTRVTVVQRVRAKEGR